MRRKSSAAADQVDPRDLIERVAAEHSSPSVPSRRAGRAASDAVPASVLLQQEVTASGRHRARPASDGGSGSPWADDAPPGADAWAAGSAGAAPVALLTHEDDDPDSPGGGDSADRVVTSGPSIAGLHGSPDGTSLVEVDRTAPARRPWVRRAVPLGVGVAAVLAATLVVTLLQPADEDPSLSATLAGAADRSVSDGVGTAADGVGDGGGSRLGDAAEGASGQIGPAIAAAEAAERRAEERAAAGAEAPSAPSSGSSGSGSDAPAAGPVGEIAQVAGEGVQAALRMGWQAIGGDEFTGSGLGENWTAYDGPGHDGQGTRTPDAVSVEDGNLVIRGDSAGNTGGIAWGSPQKYGKWEMRAKFPKGDEQYHPVLLLWPSEVSWPEGGEIDFAETTSASEDVSFFLHYGADNSQRHAKRDLDITQWNNYAVEWTPDAVVGYVNGVEWFRSTDPETLPPGPMHATVQLDYFPDGGSPQPSEMQVAWMRQYS